MTHTPTLLLILDGYGLAPAGPGNVARLAPTPTINRLLAMPGITQLDASGRAVGLPAGYMGNSEVGHLNIGAGRIVHQDMTRIDIVIENKTLGEIPAIRELLASVKATGGTLHLMGLLSDGGVHSHIRHLEALIHLAAAQAIPVRVHAFMDGRDTSPTSGADFLTQLQYILADAKKSYPESYRRPVAVGSLCGRFYAMDRDKRWERVQTAWDMLVHGTGILCPETPDAPVAAVTAAYADAETDEFLKPRLFGQPEDVCVRNDDGIFFFNFRADRARELVSAFLLPDFSGFDRGAGVHLAKPLGLATMTSYDATFDVPVAFSKENLMLTLGELIATEGLAQLRIAETEKYAHVTYFFSGGRETPFAHEDRIMVDSPRDVATYDLKPQMSAEEVTERLLAAWQSGKYTFVVCNLANPDMVGHTGNIPAAVHALETVDACVERIVSAVLSSGGQVLLTADHGNIEEMLTPEGKPQTAHTCNQVPLVVLRMGASGLESIPLKSGGKIGDIAPTILHLWGMAQPPAMSGQSLIDDTVEPHA